jgi:hypothetical protein
MSDSKVNVDLQIDPERLAALRLLLSQIGFAIDNYLVATTEPRGRNPDDPTPHKETERSSDGR